MFTVRFPNGMTIQYNDAHFLEHGPEVWNLFNDAKKERWIASIQVSAGVIVEAVGACRVYDATKTEQNARLDVLAKEIRLLKRKIGK